MNEGGVFSTEPFPKRPVISYRNFKKYILKEEVMKKEIIGYKLVNVHYINALNALDYTWSPTIYQTFKDAGILDIWFTPVYETNYEVGDIVLIGGGHAEGNGLSEDGIYELLKIDENKNPTGNHRGDSHFMFNFGENKYFRTNKKHIIRFASEKEVEEYKNPPVIINGYKVEYYGSHVSFGCAKINKDIFISLNDMGKDIYNNKKVESVTIGTGVFNRDQIAIIANHYLKNS